MVSGAELFCAILVKAIKRNICVNLFCILAKWFLDWRCHFKLFPYLALAAILFS